jgi:protease-4
MDEVCRQLRMAEADEAVRAVVVALDTPGGDVVASDAVHARLLALRARGKPVVALQRGTCASGGYYISCAADTVLCGKGTITGSIGVIFISPEVSGLAARLGVAVNVITSGGRKDMGGPFRPMRDDERAFIQGMVDQMQAQFVAVVVQGRKGRGPLPADPAAAEARLKPLADGQVFTGERALALGLVDGLGHLPEALAEARRLAGLDRATVIRYQRPGVVFGLIAQGQERAPQVVHGVGVNIEAGDLIRALQPGLAYLWTGR